MVNLLPHDRFIIQTPNALQAVIARLEAQVEPPKALRWSFNRHHAPYEGSISESGFTMHRIPEGRNSFIPQIKGRFETPVGGTVVHITMELHPSVVSFLVMWFLLFYSGALAICLSGSVAAIEALHILGLPLFVLFVFWISFWFEVERSHNDLLKIIVGQVPKSRQHRLQNFFLLRGAAFVIAGIFPFIFMVHHASESPPAREVPESFRSQ